MIIEEAQIVFLVKNGRKKGYIYKGINKQLLSPSSESALARSRKFGQYKDS